MMRLSVPVTWRAALLLVVGVARYASESEVADRPGFLQGRGVTSAERGETKPKSYIISLIDIKVKQAGLPWIWISVDVSMDVMLLHLLIKLSTCIRFVSV